MNTTCCLLLLGALILAGGAAWIARVRRGPTDVQIARVTRLAQRTQQNVWAQLYADTPNVAPRVIPPAADSLAALGPPALWTRAGTRTSLADAMDAANEEMSK